MWKERTSALLSKVSLIAIVPKPLKHGFQILDTLTDLERPNKLARSIYVDNALLKTWLNLEIKERRILYI